MPTLNWIGKEKIVNHDREIPFRLPQGGYGYIEYWGMKDKVYLDHKKERQEKYRKFDLELIEIVPKDTEHIDDILSECFGPYFPDRKFY